MQMKHGDKAKGKASKASKTSGKKVTQGGAKGKTSQSKGGEAKASSKVEKSAAKAAAKTPAKGSVEKSSASKGSVPARAPNGDASFANALVAAAFKRAVKKYNNA